jgi:hypothetical protein
VQVAEKFRFVPDLDGDDCNFYGRLRAGSLSDVLCVFFGGNQGGTTRNLGFTIKFTYLPARIAMVVAKRTPPS